MAIVSSSSSWYFYEVDNQWNYDDDDDDGDDDDYEASPASRQPARCNTFLPQLLSDPSVIKIKFQCCMRMMTVTMMMIIIVMMTIRMTMININFATTTKTPSVGLGSCFLLSLKGSCCLCNTACCLSLNVLKYIFASQTVCWCFGQWLVWQTFFPVDYSGRVIWDASFASLSQPNHQYHPPVPLHPYSSSSSSPECQRRRQIAHQCLLTTDSVEQEVRFIGTKSARAEYLFQVGAKTLQSPTDGWSFCEQASIFRSHRFFPLLLLLHPSTHPFLRLASDCGIISEWRDVTQ